MNLPPSLVGFVVLCLVATTHADPVAEAGRRVLEMHANAIVTVKLVTEMSMAFAGQNRQQEMKSELAGTVIHPRGVILVSLVGMDPTALMEAQMQAALGAQGFKREMKVKDVQILLSDGTELPAKVVLRDKDLDLALICPLEKPARPFAAVNVQDVGRPQPLEQVICLNRLAMVANRASVVSLDRISAVVARPHPFYTLAMGGNTGLGSAVFALDGRLVGFVLMRVLSTPQFALNPSSMLTAGQGGMGFLPIVLPASEVLEGLQQALGGSS